MTQLTDKAFAVEVPLFSKKHHISFTGKIATSNDQSIFFKHQDEDELDEWTSRDLPPSSYRFLFTTKDATEEQAASVVQIISNGRISGRPQYRRYDRDKELPARMWTRDARHSLETLLRSKGLDDKNNFAIIEKMK